MKADSSRKDLVTLLATVTVIIALLLGLKLYDVKTGKIGSFGAKLYNVMKK